MEEADTLAVETPAAPPELEELIRGLEEKMSESANQASTQAFNLGCLVGMPLAAVIVILTYFSAGRSWVGALVMGVLMGLSLVLFANLVAAISRKNTLRRVFQTEISQEIRAAEDRYDLDEAGFRLAASQALAPGAALLSFLPPPPELGTEKEA